MAFSVTDVAAWRDKAAECRLLAAAMANDAARSALLGVADAYELLANRAADAVQAGVKPRDWIV